MRGGPTVGGESLDGLTMRRTLADIFEGGVELTQKIDLLPKESYDMVESFVQQLLDVNVQKMNAAERSVQEHGYYSEEEVEEELERI